MTGGKVWRLNQGPFGIEQDDGWCTIALTTPSDQPIKNVGLGLIGYTWEENGPSLKARKGEETLEEHVEKLASLPFMDVLYIRCDWRDVQSSPGKLDLHPIWKMTFDAAERHDLRVGFRVQLSSPNFQPRQLSLPDFLQSKVPLVNIGRGSEGRDFDFIEPRYDHPAFQNAFHELNGLLADKFNGHPLVEFADLMMYGFWGEAHTGNLPNPFPDYLTAEKTFAEMTQLQMETWDKTPLAVNTQPDISHTGNRLIQDMAMSEGCWVRSDSIVVEEPIQVDMISNRPPWTAAIMEDGHHRHYRLEDLPLGEDGLNPRERAMLHTLDLGANYWSLWTEADNLARYHETFPNGFNTLRRRIGYRVRPSWIWQRKRYGTDELIIAIANDGVAGIPGNLRVYVESMDGKTRLGGKLDPGHPYGGKLRQLSIILPHGFAGQKMKISAEIETRPGICRPVQWACAQPVNPDGSLTFELKAHNEEGWRKGV